jgi:UDP-N-acetylmuramate-alanine ligase
MSALAIIALSQGYRVSGSDARAGAQLDAVREAGATCFVGHDARHVGGSDAHDDARDDEALTLVDPPEAVVVSSAVPGDNVEVAFARRAGIPVFSRAQWLARVTRGRAVAAVAGTHGKTSTSAALAVALRSAGLDVSAVVGGNVPQFPGGRNAVGGGDDVFVVEADEYDGAFLGLEPATAVLLNVEHDHPDMFEDERAVVAMFAQFVRRVKPGGLVVACGDDANVRALVATLAVRNDLPENRFTEDDVPENVRDPEAVSCVTFGFGAANAWRAVDLRADTRTGGCSFTVTHEGAFVSEMSVPGTGAYAALNALAAFVAGLEILRRERRGRDAATDAATGRSLAKSFAPPEGVARRMQMIGATERVAVYDDYAHHPTAARLATAAIKERHAGAFLAVAFQPHTRSRTEAMFDAFADALGVGKNLDALVVTPVFDARPERQGQTERGRRDKDEASGAEAEASGAEASDLAARLAARAGGAFAATEAEAVDAVVDAVRDAMTSAKTRAAREDKNDFHGKKQVVVLCLGAGAGFDVARRVFARLDELDRGDTASGSAAVRRDADETTR